MNTAGFKTARAQVKKHVGTTKITAAGGDIG